jgi:uncharacterized protein (DUF305 family)
VSRERIIDDVIDVTGGNGTGTGRSGPRPWPWYGAVAVLAVALVALGTAVVLLADRRTGPTIPAPAAVDAGFARDMQTHHLQAVRMAGIVRDRTGDPLIRTMAFNIETSQREQVGEMTGWLGMWGLPVNHQDRPMAWMGVMAAEHRLQPDGRMPGMASTAEIDQLRTLPPARMDVLFLQLMIRHHQGGLPMLDYAAHHAAIQAVRILAEKSAAAQTWEITTLRGMLADRGGQPLPPPA